MKKSFLAGLLSCLAATQSFTIGHTQASNMLASHPNHVAPMATAATSPPAYLDQGGAAVRAKVVNTFDQLFDNPTDVQWNLNNYQYLASFKHNNKQCKALFNMQGGMLYCMTYGTQQDLPRDVYRLLKGTYIDYNISTVTEVKTPQAQAWVVNLEDKDNLVVAKVVDGELEEMHHYKTHF